MRWFSGRLLSVSSRGTEMSLLDEILQRDGYSCMSYGSEHGYQNHVTPQKWSRKRGGRLGKFLTVLIW